MRFFISMRQYSIDIELCYKCQVVIYITTVCFSCGSTQYLCIYQTSIIGMRKDVIVYVAYALGKWSKYLKRYVEITDRRNLMLAFRHLHNVIVCISLF